MCGIVGYIGKKTAQDVLTGGLRRLEYRGYDSAGIATLDKIGKATLIRTKGKVAELDKIVSKSTARDSVGIGHTRWATHGIPSEKNAHPHRSGDILLVHNGIIENYLELRELLAKKGYKFASDTDSEVLAALIDSIYQNGAKHSLLDAVSEALGLIVGAYGIAVLSVKNPDEIVIAKNSSPLIVGVGKNEIFIASDASALLGRTDQVIYLNDGEVGLVTRSGVKLQDLSAKPVDKKIEKLEFSLEAIQKKGYKHFLLKEIHEQPETLRSTLSGRLNAKEGVVSLGGPGLSQTELAKIKHVLIVGCGTAYYAGVLAGYYLEQFLPGITTQAEIASELRYKAFNLPADTLALIVSQSGETADTRACLTELKRRGVNCLGIVNAVGSTIARECGRGIYLHVGAEISVASTKAFTSQVAAMLLFGLTIAQAKGASGGKLANYIAELDKLPDEIGNVINNYENEIKRLSKMYQKYQHALYLGRDTSYPIALEGALKLKEISYVNAQGYAAGELKHGPIALVDDSFFVLTLLPNNWLFDKTLSNLLEVNARGGHTFVITNSAKQIHAENVLKLDTKLDLLAPLVFNVVCQLFAYYIAVLHETDVDQPRNLAKSVTVE